MLRRLAIVNRGEPAMRAIHAVRELNATRSQPIAAIALHTDADRGATFVRQADEAVAIGPSYLDLAALERALRESRADGAWGGWGFVAEFPAFAALCERLGVVFVGPSAGAMRRVGDKIGAKLLAERAGVPVAPWSGGPVESADDALRAAAAIGFPLMVKAAAGGGGRGIRRVEQPDALPAAFESARAEALGAFGDGTLLLERVLEHARHIEVQVVADGQGGAWALGVRDCSYQRRNQKVVEETPSPALTAEQDAEIRAAAARMMLEAGYRGAGTVEFLYEPDGRRFSFMEVNARLQVEHPITEMVTGADLVKLQIHIAEGGRLEGDPPASTGHAIEARLNAEDPALGFAPAPGRIELLRLPAGPGVRVDTGVAEGDSIPAQFDSMIAKLIAWGRDRDEALARLRRALADTTVVIDGGTTNQGFLLELLARPEVRAGEVETTWLDRLHLRGEIAPVRHAAVALVQAAIELSDEEVASDRARFQAFARRGRPQANAALERRVELRHGGLRYAFAVAEIGPDRYRAGVDGVAVEAVVERRGEHERRIEIAGSAHRALISRQGADLLIEVDGVPHRVARDDGGLVRNISPAVVVSIPVTPGDEVEKGDVVAVVESMKMENSLTAPFAGRVRRVLATPNVHVAAHEPLLQIDESGDAAGDADGDRAVFTTGEPAAGPARCMANLERLSWLVMGYDVGAGEVRRIVDDIHDVCSDFDCDPGLVPGEHRLLALFADVRAVARPRQDADAEGALGRSSEQHLHAYLRSLDPDAEGLPRRFLDTLERALHHYGVTSLDRTPALERACYRLFVAQQRADAARAAVVAILDRRLERAGELRGRVGDDFRDALDGLVQATEGHDPVVADLAREIRFAYFDEPLIEAARERVYETADRLVDGLADSPGRVRDLVELPQPLAPMLTRRMHGASQRVASLLLETMARRYYRMRSPGEFERCGPLLVAPYVSEGGERRLATAFVELDELTTAARALGALPEGAPVVADFYAEHRGRAPPHDELAAQLRASLAEAELPAAVRRIVVAVAEPGRGRGMSAVDLLTFRHGDEGIVEDELLRGLHPMMGERLELWRLSNFALERLPSAEDVYLFHGAARENPKDERLFALAEVRDLTPVRDEQGRVSGLPELERVLVEALEAIRGFQAHRTPSRRLHWNRVVLYAWPVIELSTDDVTALMSRLTPLTSGLGIEMLVVRGRMREADGEVRERVMRFFSPVGRGAVVEIDDPPAEPLRPLDESARRIVTARRRGTRHPAEIVKLLAPAHSGDGAARGQPTGDFEELDLDADGRLVPVDRPPASNPSGIVVGLIRNYDERYPEGMQRVLLGGDPTRALGSLAEPECRRIMAALDLAEELGVPVEWFAVSAGAKIAMDSGTENMDWIAAVLRRIIEYTQRGGELNVVVTGINVGAQPYWNAEATMLMHTRGILVMTPDSAMVLTGKQALDYSGGVSAEDNFGIGGYERIMGPNGQAQYWAPDLASACRVLLSHYEHTYVAPGERFPRRAATSDPAERDVCAEPHSAPGSPLARIGEIFSDATNPDRKLPFDIRAVMRAVADKDREPLERWAGMSDAENAVVWDAHLGGWPVEMLGIESHPLPRYGQVPADGPDRWTSGTLFPRSSKKIARAVNAASGRRPLVVLANLAGFDGSPESMREWQLEFGAEIGRAVTNFRGPIVFCVVSRYHGGAFVVFSQKLNEGLEAFALEGARASVIGGAPAAAVVFVREVDQAALADPRISALDERIAAADGAERQRLRAERDVLWATVRNQKQGELAARFDSVHSVGRAVEMGSVSGVVPPAALRPFLVGAVERGMARTLEREGAADGSAAVADALRG